MAEFLSTKKGDSSFQFGHFLAHPPPGEEVVITGISGKFPNSRDVHHFRENLFNKVNMVSNSSNRWKNVNPDFPKTCGQLLETGKFDCGFFGIHYRDCDDMDPMIRMILEVTTEAIFDAGYQPADLEHTKTGVFVGVCFIETLSELIQYRKPQAKLFTGASASMFSNRVSYFFKWNGPSETLDTACSSSLYALREAFIAIRKGECDRAVVAGCNLCLLSNLMIQFSWIGVLSKKGACRPFDIDGDGYIRSDTIGVLFLEKSKSAKRIYATVVHSKANCDGFKFEGSTHPSALSQKALLQEIYNECGTNPANVSYFEAHGTGTIVGDCEECKGIDMVFSKGRTTPLLFGSVKSNMGHSEAASGMASITKAILAFETGHIPPNIHYNTPRPELTAVIEENLKVVTEKMPLPDNNGLIGVSNYGFGGANSHALLKWNTKKKIVDIDQKDILPRLICVSGRTKEAVNVLLDDVLQNNVDTEHIRLLQDIFKKDIPTHLYRGYSLVNLKKEVKRSITICSKPKISVYILFGKFSESLLAIGKYLTTMPQLDSFFKRVKDLVQEKGISINMICQQSQIQHNILVGVIFQIMFIEFLKLLKIKPSGVFGESTGNIATAYYYEALTLRQVLYWAYYIDKHTTDENKTSLENGGEIINRLKSCIKNSTDVFTKKFGSVELFVNAIMEINANVPIKNLAPRAMFWELGYHSLTISINKKKIFPINSIQGKHLYDFFLTIGRLYELGYDVQLQNIYPEIKFPVSRGTPMISSKIRWNHRKDFFVVDCQASKQDQSKEEITFSISLMDKSWSYLKGHIVDGRNIFPATGYLYLVWQAMAYQKNVLPLEMFVKFENCKFLTACTLPKPDDPCPIKLTVSIQRLSNKFEVLEFNTLLASGTIKVLDKSTNIQELHISQRSMDCTEKLLNTKDIYKELRLRGYHYENLFKSLAEYSTNKNEGKIIWQNNFVAFMDNMLQTKLICEDTRLLYVPTKIKSVTINAPSHMQYINGLIKEKNGQNDPTRLTLVPVTLMRDINQVRSGFIEISGMIGGSIPKRKITRVPVLEKYQFVPNDCKLTLAEAMRVNIQIMLENAWHIKNKVIELIGEDKSVNQLLSPLIKNAFNDQPLIQLNIKIFSKRELDTNIIVENKSLNLENDCSLIVGSNLLEKKRVLSQALKSLRPIGYVLSREPLGLDINLVNIKDFVVITRHFTNEEQIVLLSNNVKSVDSTVINVSMIKKDFSWLPLLQKSIKMSRDVILYSQDEPLSGIIGLVNCIRKEPGDNCVRCVFISGKSPKFDPSNTFYRKQLNKNMAINVCKEGVWGTYRHLLFDKTNLIEREHCYVISTVKGDLSSLKWMEGPLTNTSKLGDFSELVSVYYSSLNFKDVMVVSGKLGPDATTNDRLMQESVEGFEFAGRLVKSGKRVMGMSTRAALATLFEADANFLWDVPSNWTLKEASTVPVVYLTCIYALHMVGKMKPSDSVLIHSGTGGIGQAAIHLCLKIGCTVFVTVGNQEKRNFIKQNFPQIRDSHIGNSRDLSFEQMVKKRTGGRGVDIVLNSLAEEKLLATIRCLAIGGRFLEIGRYDISKDNLIKLSFLNKEISFYGIELEQIMFSADKFNLINLLKKGIENGTIQPIKATFFKPDEVEKAFRFMATGKHIGKVVIKIREEESEKIYLPLVKKCKGNPRYFCSKNSSYIICGGLGGIGLELSDWLILRGARNIVLNSRNGISTGYQSYRTKLWKSYGCHIRILTADVTTQAGCKALINEAHTLGPVKAIFNLAMVLQDGILENQTLESFHTCFRPKAFVTEHLDKLSRIHCPELEDFVVFSSVSCGRGNAGQTNYGMANSVMERICEKRREEGYPALAIQWGAISDVGILSESQNQNTELKIGGTLQQSIASCLQVLDLLLRQKDAAVVSSIVVAEKKKYESPSNLIEEIANILGISDVKSVSMQSTLAESGLDSISSVEIKQVLEREFNVLVTVEEVRSMNFAKINELQSKLDIKKEAKKCSGIDQGQGIEMIINMLGEEISSNHLIRPLTSKREVDNITSRPKIVMFPGIEGTPQTLKSLAANLPAEVFSLQYCVKDHKNDAKGMADHLFSYVLETISNSDPFHIICHSFGCYIALEVVSKLEKLGYFGNLISIDGAPDQIKEMLKIFNLKNDEVMLNSIVFYALGFLVSATVIEKYKPAIVEARSVEEKLDLFKSIISLETTLSPEYQKESLIATFKRVRLARDYIPSFSKQIQSPVLLIKPSISSVGLKDDYGLSKFCSKVDIKTFEGTHVTVLENGNMAMAIMKWINTSLN